jgi:adenosylcobyric acid synthase
MTGALLVAGTTSDAGKSVVCTGICRWLRRQGLSVAPFKAQNMALNSVVCESGAEIARAQASQAQAAGTEPDARMNPILLKPSGKHTSQVVVMGKPLAYQDAASYQRSKQELMPQVLAALADLRDRYDVVVCEGAGSPAEINLRRNDLANMGLARAAELPVVIVGDIDRGGVFASLYGSLALLDQADQRHIQGFMLNKFRGDQSLLGPALGKLKDLTGRETLAVLPWISGIGLDAEDSLDIPAGSQPLDTKEGEAISVCVVSLERMSNFTDFEPLAVEPSVSLSFSRLAADIEKADLAIVPGTKATVSDLQWLRDRGIDRALRRRANNGSPVLAICGGYQMLGEEVTDTVESAAGWVEGLGMLPITTEFEPEKVLSKSRGLAKGFEKAPVAGYEIHHGRVYRRKGKPLFEGPRVSEGICKGSVVGTSWHGVLECDAFRHALLRWVSRLRGLSRFDSTTSFAQLRERRFDDLGDLIEEHADTDALLRLITEGPQDKPSIVPGESVACSYF